ncbi:MAG: hypothetical protein P4L82_05750 [Ancalomicrobiaceae bacterium]|nr:hypothetical protein [Ancalomicrobiaceae bacterium]
MSRIASYVLTAFLPIAVQLTAASAQTATPVAQPVSAAAPKLNATCLSSAAAQDAVVAGHVMRFADVKRRISGDIVKADLCNTKGKLAYVVTVLTSDGMVKRVALDASSGEMIYGGK